MDRPDAWALPIARRTREWDGEIFDSVNAARIIVEAWRRHYNTVRPHASPGNHPPAPEVQSSVSAHYRRQTMNRYVVFELGLLLKTLPSPMATVRAESATL